MNSVNASMGFFNFQIRLRRSPWLIPPIVPATLTPCVDNDTNQNVLKMISQIETDVAEAKDNLLQAKVFQSHYANLNRSPDTPFKIGDKVMLSTLHCRQQFKKKGEKRAAKFFPHFDGPYDIIDEHLATSNYTLELPNSPNTYPTYHASERCCPFSQPQITTSSTGSHTRQARRIPRRRNYRFSPSWLRLAVPRTMGRLWS